jgi:type IV pilus assembly protein PilC
MFITITIVVLLFYIFLSIKKPGLALVTSPFVTAGLFFPYVYILHEGLICANNLFYAAIIAPFIFLATILTILICQRGEERDKWPWQWSKWILIILLMLVSTVVMAAIAGPLAIYGLGFLILLMGLFISFGMNQRHAVTTYVISTIGGSMRQNLPLATALQSAAGQEQNKRSRILRGISNWLVKGYSLSESVRRGFAKCPGNVAAMITAAEKANQLPQAFASIEADMVQTAGEHRRVKPVHPSYPIAVLSVIFFIVFGLMVFVIPKFTEVLQEMLGADLPRSTRILMTIASTITFQYGWLTTIIVLVLIIIGLISLRTKYRPRRPQKPYLLSLIGDFLKWHTPIVRWFEFNYSMAQTVELLRASLRAGWTVNEAVKNTLGLDVNCFFRRRLAKWLRRIEAGDNITSAANSVGLGSTLAWAFDADINQGNTVAILEMLENFYRTNYSYRVNLMRFITMPCVTVLMGIGVGFVLYAIFSPMVAIISNLADLVP